MSNVTTWTIMTVVTEGGCYALTSKVSESVDSALGHLKAMSEGKAEPLYDVRSGTWRWSWEYEGLQGARCTDTVRIY